jgi:hypothetical protein
MDGHVFPNKNHGFSVDIFPYVFRESGYFAQILAASSLSRRPQNWVISSKITLW